MAVSVLAIAADEFVIDCKGTLGGSLVLDACSTCGGSISDVVGAFVVFVIVVFGNWRARQRANLFSNTIETVTPVSTVPSPSGFSYASNSKPDVMTPRSASLRPV